MKKINLFEILLILPILFLTSSTIFPWLTTFGNYSLIAGCLLLFWIGLAFINDPNYFNNVNSPLFKTLIFIGFAFVLSILSGNFTIVNRYLSVGICLFYYIIYDYLYKHDYVKLLKIIMVVICIFASITWFLTTRALLINPYISRSIKSSGEYSLSLATQGIGGYEFIYFLVFVSVISCYKFIFSIKNKNKICALLPLLMSLYTIVLSNYFTALSLSLIGCGCVVLYRISMHKNKLILIFSIFVSSVLLIFIEPVLLACSDFIENISGEAKTADRIEELVFSILYDSDSDLLSGRLPTMMLSLQTGFKYPVFGSILFANDVLSGIGQHSYILDTFAFFGLPLAILNFNIILQPYKENRIKKNRVLTICIFCVTILLLMFNNITYSIGLAYGLIYPYFCDYNNEVKDGNIAYEK